MMCGRPIRRGLMMAWMVAAGLGAALFTAMCRPVAPALPAANGSAAHLPNGVASGDVTSASVVLWARASAPGMLTFTWGEDLTQGSASITATVHEPTLPVTVAVSELIPNTAYRYRVTTASGESAEGRFRTSAVAGVRRGLRFGVSGDWRGDLAPFPALANAPDRDLDFFVALGDTIYSDIGSPAVPGRAAVTLDEFYAKYGESLARQAGTNYWAALRAAAPIFAVIDDHEVANDFAGGAAAASDSRFGGLGRVNASQLYRTALDAFQAYMPLAAARYAAVPGDDGRGEPSGPGAPQLYRYRTFGDDGALYMLDMRSFRDPPLAKIDPNLPGDAARFAAESFTPGRTLLGRGQLDRLQAELLDAQQRGISWKFVALPDPIQLLDQTSAQDRYQGYAAERTELLRFIASQGITNVVFIAADIHGTLANNLTYQEGPDGPQVPVAAWEITVGPAAMYAPYGPTKVFIYGEEGSLSDADRATYADLPVHNDPDSTPDDRDDFVKAALDAHLAELGYDRIGLDGSLVPATLLEGDYIASHVYGWTEFEIDAATQALTVTTWGIAPYTEKSLAEDPAGVAGRVPAVVSRFVVKRE